MTTQQNDNPHPLPHESGENTPNGGGIRESAGAWYNRIDAIID